MPHRLFTPAEIWKAKALLCQPEQLLPESRACEDCQNFGACQFDAEEPIGRNQRCRYLPSQFADAWRIRIDQPHEAQRASRKGSKGTK
ncbi:MAG: hypothetical protein ACLP9L_41630 [Thermoguttaceae bacterium]